MADAATQPTGAHPSQQAIDLTLIDPSLRPSTDDTPVEPSEPSEPTSAQPMDIDNEYEDQPSDQEDEPHEPPPSSRRHKHSDHTVFNTQYEKLDQLVTAVQKWARELGYNVVKGRSNNTVNDFGHTRLYLIYGVFKAEHKALVATYIDRPGIRNREIAVELEQRFPDLYFTTRQLENLRYKLKKEAMAGYTPFQQTMKFLTESKIHFEVNWADTAETKPTAIFWTDPWGEECWRH
ncbi:hypothetical protein QBC45DRAFT_445575 [Copromyces sp. CBS 386.78]|nr:hypothetical protein QBC45DRAFT_445575 [Copromyces sp. CBS 386.78]